MRRLYLLCIFLLCVLSPAAAQDNQAGYPLPKLAVITPENASMLGEKASIGGSLPGDLAWSPDGKTLAIGMSDMAVTFDIINDNLPHPYLGGKDVRFDEIGHLISGGKISDITTGAEIGDALNTTPSGKSEINYRTIEGHAAVVLTNLATGTETILNTGLRGKINHLVFSPDEQFAAIEMTPYVEGYPHMGAAVQLWNASTGKLIKLPIDEPYALDPIGTFGFHNQGKLLVLSTSFAGEDGYSASVHIWDGQTGADLNPTANLDYVPVVFSPDDSLMAFPNTYGITLWSDHKIGVLASRSTTPVFSPDGQMLAGIGGDAINVWDIDDALQLGQPKKQLPVTGKIIDDLIFSPDGKLLADVEYDKRVRVWNLETNTVEAVINGIDGTPQFSPNSQWILGKRVDTQRFVLWDARTGEALMDFDDYFVINADWTLAAQGRLNIEIVEVPTGKYVRTLNVLYNYLGEIRQFDANTGRVIFEKGMYDARTGEKLFENYSIPPLDELALSTDGQRILTVTDPEQYDGVPERFVSIIGPDRPAAQSESGFITSDEKVFLTPDGKHIGYLNNIPTFNSEGSARLEFRDVETGEHIAEWLLPGFVDAFTISHDGKWLVLGSSDGYDGRIVLLNLSGDLTQTQPIIRLVNSPNDVGGLKLTRLAFSADDSHLVMEGFRSFCGDGCDHVYLVKAWDFDQVRLDSPLGTMFGTTIDTSRTPVFSRDGSLLMVTSDNSIAELLNTGTLQLWDTTANKQLIALQGDGIAAFSPDGRLLAVHDGDRTLIYDTDELKHGIVRPLVTCPDRDKPVTEVAFSPDGTILYIVSENRVRLFGIRA